MVNPQAFVLWLCAHGVPVCKGIPLWSPLVSPTWGAQGGTPLHCSHGSVVSPIKYLSTPFAARRPSAIAQTTNDWPRAMSPAAKTPGTLVIFSSLIRTLPRSSIAKPSCDSSPWVSGPRKPMANRTSWAGHSRSVPGISRGTQLPLLLMVHSICTVCTPAVFRSHPQQTVCSSRSRYVDPARRLLRSLPDRSQVDKPWAIAATGCQVHARQVVSKEFRIGPDSHNPASRQFPRSLCRYRLHQ